MPLQNRVTPFGDIVAIEQRGMFTGNRGIIHDPASRTLLIKRWSNKAWLICRCEFRGMRRQVMSRRSWTELFFFDEATALAAGHRPCFFCRREAARAFAVAFAGPHHGATLSAQQIDATLHEERLAHGKKRIHPLRASPATLPDGAMVVLSGDAYLMAGGQAFLWTIHGYQARRRISRADGLLTPPSTLAALRAGYPCELHPSIASASVRRPRSPTRK